MYLKCTSNVLWRCTSSIFEVYLKYTHYSVGCFHHFQSWFNTVKRTSDFSKTSLEHLQVQILKILPLSTKHGGGSIWPSTWHNSTNAQIRALDQPLIIPNTFRCYHFFKDFFRGLIFFLSLVRTRSSEVILQPPFLEAFNISDTSIAALGLKWL